MTMPEAAVAGDTAWGECAALLYHDFASFAARAFRELNPRTPFAMNWHVELIAAKLAAVHAGRIPRLIVSLPPRHRKSHLASVAFPAWCLGHEPSTEIVCVSYAQDLADKLSRDCRRLLASDWYQGLFPTRLAPRHQAVPEFETTAQGSRVATSVGGVLTGRGADLIVIDDPLKPEEALSQTQRQAANEWYDHTLYSRLNDKLSGAIVLIMHRLHEDDLPGHVLAREKWEVVRLSAIAEEDEWHRVETVFGRQSFRRKAGEVLHPVREPPEMLGPLRRTLGEYNFAAQYQQAPSPRNTMDEASNCGPECHSAHSDPEIRRTAIATTISPVGDPPVEACLAQLLDHLGIAGAHFAGRSLADVQGFIAKHSERIASLTLVCPA